MPDYLADLRLRPGRVYMADRFGYLPDTGDMKSQVNPLNSPANDRFGYLPDTGDMDLDSRTRSTVEILGTANTRQIPKSKVAIVLREITGSGGGDPNNPAYPVISGSQSPTNSLLFSLLPPSL